MWNAHIDVENQQFVIEDRNGVIVAIRLMPYRKYPNPGKEVLMDEFNNSVAWSLICDLVEAANKGR